MTAPGEARSVLFIASMKSIVLTSLLVAALGTNALSDPVASVATGQSIRESEREETRAFVAVKEARIQVAATRARWDAAVADDHPVEAGIWAKRHYEAMQVRNAALHRWEAATDRVNADRYARR